MKRHLFRKDLVDGPGRKILVRIDMNGGEKEGYKIWRYSKALENYKELADMGCSVVLMTHHGRRKNPDFRENLEFLAEALRKTSNINVEYVHSLVEGLDGKIDRPGIYFLKNVRASEYEKQGGPNEMSRFFSEKFDYFVNDAPAVCHRGHTSVTLPLHMKGFVGEVLFEEFERLDKVASSSEKILLWGGAKMDKMKYIRDLLDDKWKILLGGLPAAKFEACCRGENNETSLLKEYGDQVVCPEDFVVKSGRIVDVGPKTVDMYENMVSRSGGIFSGPMGIYEEGYSESSIRLMKHCTAILGGHSGNIAHKYGIGGIMTSGGAALAYIAGHPLPGMEAILKR